MNAPLYRFGPYLLDPAARELRRDGERVALPQKALACLLYLIEHRERAVGRTELIHAVWGRVHFSDTHLGKVMFQVRRAVGDSGGDQGKILTVPRFGYRWIAATRLEHAATTGLDAVPDAPAAAAPADVAIESQAAEAATVEAAAPPEPAGAMPPADDAPSPPLPIRRARRSPAALIALAVLVLAAGIGLHRHWRAPARVPVAVAVPAVSAAEPLAVLPVAVDADASWAWLRLGLMDLIGNRLREAGLVVVPSDNVVSVLRAAPADAGAEAARAAVRDSAGPGALVEPQAGMTAGGWQVRLVLHARDGGTRQVEATAGDAIAAGEAAVNRLLAQIGIDAPGDAAPATADPLVEREQRIEAAFLADQLAEVGRLLDQAPPQQRDAPALRLRRARLATLSGHAAEVPALLGDLADVPSESAPELRARVLIELGLASIHQEVMDRAELRFSEAIDLLEKRNEPGLLAGAYMGRGVSYVARGATDAALGDFARARVVRLSAGDRLGAASAELNEATADLDAGRYAQAIPVLTRVAELFRRFGAIGSETRAISGLIRCHVALLETAEALAASQRGEELLRQLEQPIHRAALQSSLASAQLAGGRWAQARFSIGETVLEIRRSGVGTMTAVYTGQQARVELELGHAEIAERLAAEAAATADGPVHAAMRADAWLTLTRALRALGRDREAAERIAELVAWAAAQDDGHVRWRVELAQAEQAWAERRREAAFARYEQARTEARTAGSPAELLAVVDSFGRALLTDGELVRAAAVIAEVARWSGQDYDAALLQVQLYHALGQLGPWRAALNDARLLAGERVIPAALTAEPVAGGRARIAASAGEGGTAAPLARR